MVLKIAAFFFLATGTALAFPSSKVEFALPPSYEDERRSLSGVRGNLGIYDGQNTTINQHPYTVAIYFIFYGEYMYNCGGTILTDSWVYTDGNCAGKPEEMLIFAGTNHVVDEFYPDLMDDNGTSYQVEKVVFHPHFRDRTYDHSFALIKIKGTFKWSDKIGNISIASKNIKPQTEVTFVGFGSDGHRYGPLYQGNMTMLSKKTCKWMFEGMLTWFNTNLCMYNEGRTTMCNGDFGDPVIHNGLLVGHVVGGPVGGMCASNSPPTVVGDTRMVLEWIESHTGPVSVQETH